ncbi:MAG TPA: hypothetical protein VGI78_10680 [Acetobacteraceae bacterium]|jgi:hypothetical protein
MVTRVAYPSGQVTSFNVGVGLNDISLLASGNGWSGASVTAHAGGGQALATPLLNAINLIAVCATAGDSVVLPPAMGGQTMWIANGGAAAAEIFGNASTADTINGVAGSTGISVAAGKSTVLMSAIRGSWFAIVSA